MQLGINVTGVILLFLPDCCRKRVVFDWRLTKGFNIESCLIFVLKSKVLYFFLFFLLIQFLRPKNNISLDPPLACLFIFYLINNYAGTVYDLPSRLGNHMIASLVPVGDKLELTFSTTHLSFWPPFCIRSRLRRSRTHNKYTSTVISRIHEDYWDI